MYPFLLDFLVYLEYVYKLFANDYLDFISICSYDLLFTFSFINLGLFLFCLVRLTKDLSILLIILKNKHFPGWKRNANKNYTEISAHPN
jgi:hypothetical protein